MNENAPRNRREHNTNFFRNIKKTVTPFFVNPY